MNWQNSPTKFYFSPRPAWRLVATLMAFLALGACGLSDVGDLEEYVNNTRSKHQGTVEALPEIKPYESYRYHAGQQRDPFKPSVSLVKSISLSAGNGISPNAKRTKEDLEKFSLDSLTMVGVMHNQGLTWGIIKAPDNAIYRVRKGNYMGLNHGKILSIKENKIDVREIVADGMGGWIERSNKVLLSE